MQHKNSPLVFFLLLFGLFITPLDYCCPRGIFHKPLDFSLLPINLIEYFSRMVTFSFGKLTVCPMSHICPTDTKDPVASSGKKSHLFASYNKFGMLSDA